jgi:IS4 transposase
MPWGREACGKTGRGRRGLPVPESLQGGGGNRGDYLFFLKGNQREERLPGEKETEWRVERDGQVWTYRAWASRCSLREAAPYLPKEIRAFPGARQVVRLERVVVHKGTGEVRGTLSHALTSLEPEMADAKRLGELLVARWEIENGHFWVRDFLLREDICRLRGMKVQVLVALGALLVSLLHREGIRQKRASLEAFTFRPLSALRFLGLYAS